MKKYRPAIMAVVFRKTRTRTMFLLLHRTKNWRGYEFPKGGINDGESEWDAVNRELNEEVGLPIMELKKTDFIVEYKWPRNYKADYPEYNGVRSHLFIVEVRGEKVSLDKEEHDNYIWVEADKALKRLTWKDQQNALKYALQHYFFMPQ
jgi:putative (di)nucleoside polyphosphate hydrolase